MASIVCKIYYGNQWGPSIYLVTGYSMLNRQYRSQTSGTLHKTLSGGYETQWMERICLCFTPSRTKSARENSISSVARYGFNVFSAFNPSKVTHTWSSGQPMLRRPGSSWGFGGLLKGLTSVVENSCRRRDSNPQPQVTSPTVYPLGPGCPMYYIHVTWFGWFLRREGALH